ncbi:MAG: SDR family oxidoreductase [Thermaceae bacterium]|nr:SDR family oxidoreductase [Thermaceae bacterium]
MSDVFSLDGQITIVTGASRGIGLEIAKAMRTAGAHIVVADIDAEVGPKSAAELGGDFVHTDVTDSASVKALVARVMAQHGRIDVLVNNAGVVRNTPSEAVPDEEWRWVLSVNLDGVFWCCREVGKVMLERGRGSIVNIASMSGVISNHPQPQSAYNVSKAGVIMLTKSLAGEWASRGVRVNAISPGYIATPMTKKGLDTPEWREAWLSTTPMGRLGEPAEIGPLAVFLASDASSFMTGSNVLIDGGYTAW